MTMSLDLILGILRGVKVYDSDTKTWRVYDSQGNELVDSSGILLQGLHGLLLRNASNVAAGRLYGKRNYVHIERDGEYLIFPSAAYAAAYLEWEKTQSKKKSKKVSKKVPKKAKVKPIKQPIRIEKKALDTYLKQIDAPETVKSLVDYGEFERLIALYRQMEDDDLLTILLAA